MAATRNEERRTAESAHCVREERASHSDTRGGSGLSRASQHGVRRAADLQGIECCRAQPGMCAIETGERENIDLAFKK